MISIIETDNTEKNKLLNTGIKKEKPLDPKLIAKDAKASINTTMLKKVIVNKYNSQ